MLRLETIVANAKKKKKRQAFAQKNVKDEENITYTFIFFLRNLINVYAWHRSKCFTCIYM